MSLPTVRKGALIFKGDTKPVGAKPKIYKLKNEAVPDDIQQCQGRIVSNGNTVQGLETLFKDEVEVGDIIIARNPQTGIKEERIVKNIVSQRSLTIDRPFSSDFVSTTEYSIKRESKNVHATAEAAVGSKSVLVYQKKTGLGGYRTVAENLDREFTEEELLDMKCKKVHDKYC